jgi:hypothetical protein
VAEVGQRDLHDPRVLLPLHPGIDFTKAHFSWKLFGYIFILKFWTTNQKQQIQNLSLHYRHYSWIFRFFNLTNSNLTKLRETCNFGQNGFVKLASARTHHQSADGQVWLRDAGHLGDARLQHHGVPLRHRPLQRQGGCRR